MGELAAAAAAVDGERGRVLSSFMLARTTHAVRVPIALRLPSFCSAPVRLATSTAAAAAAGVPLIAGAALLFKGFDE